MKDLFVLVDTDLWDRPARWSGRMVNVVISAFSPPRRYRDQDECFMHQFLWTKC